MCYAPPESYLIEAQDILRHDPGVIKSLDTLHRAKYILQSAVIKGDDSTGPGLDDFFELLNWVTERQGWYELPPLERAVREAREVYEDAEQRYQDLKAALLEADFKVRHAWCEMISAREAARKPATP